MLNRAAFGVESGKIQSADTRQRQGPGTHRTGYRALAERFAQAHSAYLDEDGND